MAEHYDLNVISSGPGGASLTHALAPTGKRMLILERGDYLPREEVNWSSQAVFVERRYQAAETCKNADGRIFHPQLHYCVDRLSAQWTADTHMPATGPAFHQPASSSGLHNLNQICHRCLGHCSVICPFKPYVASPM